MGPALTSLTGIICNNSAFSQMCLRISWFLFWWFLRFALSRFSPAPNYVSGVRILKRRESVDVDDKVFVNFVTQYSVKGCTVKHRSFGTISIGEWLYLIIQLTFKFYQI